MGASLRPGRALLAAALVVTIGHVAGCGSPLRWHLARTPSAATVAAALDESVEGENVGGGTLTAQVPAVPEPVRVRPCCAFGADLRARVGLVPVPLLEIGNVVGPEAIGPHKFDGGLLALRPGQDPSASRDPGERNGLVYTCRGGFIDIAHVRDYADLTIFLAAQVHRGLRDGATVQLRAKGGARRIVIHPVPAATIDAVGARGLAIATGQWLAVRLAIWHEIATWYGWSAFALFPETASAFSPEDVYSDIVGTRIAGGIMAAQGADTDTLYEANMNVWMERVLAQLGGQPAAVGRAAMFAVDGQWWDSSRRLPDKQLTVRRNLDIGPFVSPWLVSDAGIGPSTQALLDEHCGADVRPAVLRNPDDYRGVPLREVATLEIEVDAALVGRGLPLPRASAHITQDDFPAIVAAIAVEASEWFGTGADAPFPLGY